MRIDLRHGDCLDVLRILPDCSVDAVVTDPPYGLAFMGKRWDYDVPSVEVWAECLRVLKPGGHLLAFAGTRTQHRMAVRIEDAGFEIRDMIAWVYGSGFPKSLDVSKAIDKMDASEEQERRRLRFTAWVRSTGATSRQINEATGTNMGGHYTTAASQPAIMTREHLEQCRHLLGDVPKWVEREADIRSVESRNFAEREVVGVETRYNEASGIVSAGRDERTLIERKITAPATPEAQQWSGWGTALKPSIETITWATKPLPPEKEQANILVNLWKLEARLWLLSSASVAAQSSMSSQSEYGAACAIAQWTAEDATSTRAALRGLMDTWQCEMATHMSLSIVTSWRRTLEESSKLGSTSTTETESSTTIDWRTLSCCLSRITPESIIQACSLPGGFIANASTAAQIFNASLASLQSTLTLFAIEPATWRALDDFRGEAVKPNLDPVVMARKPLAGTVAANVLEHGTGAINVDGCRVGTDSHVIRGGGGGGGAGTGWGKKNEINAERTGRFPANLLHDGSDEVVGLFPQSSSGANPTRRGGMGYHGAEGQESCDAPRGAESGSAARFFYCAKASKRDRDEGLDAFAIRSAGEVTGGREDGSAGLQSPRAGAGRTNGARNVHPTVKPTDLMRYLCRLVTPPGGVVLDPFMGSGSTGKGAVLEGFRFIGIEREVEYMEIARARIEAVTPTTDTPAEADAPHAADQLPLF